MGHKSPNKKNHHLACKVPTSNTSNFGFYVPTAVTIIILAVLEQSSPTDLNALLKKVKFINVISEMSRGMKQLLQDHSVSLTELETARRFFTSDSVLQPQNNIAFLKLNSSEGKNHRLPLPH